MPHDTERDPPAVGARRQSLPPRPTPEEPMPDQSANTASLLQAITDGTARLERRFDERMDELGGKVDRLVDDGRKAESRIQNVEKDIANAEKDRTRAVAAWEKWRDEHMKTVSDLTKRVEVSEKDISNWRAVSGVLFALTGLLIGVIKLFH